MKNVLSSALAALLFLVFMAVIPQSAFATSQIAKVDIDFRAYSINPDLPCTSMLCYAIGNAPVLDSSVSFSYRGWEGDDLRLYHFQNYPGSAPIIGAARVTFNLTDEEICNENLKAIRLIGPDGIELARKDIASFTGSSQCALSLFIPYEKTYNEEGETIAATFSFGPQANLWLVTEHDGEDSIRLMPITFK